MNELKTISNVKGFIDADGTAQLNLEDVARGLGFTTVVNANDYVRWPRVRVYLGSFGFLPQVANDEITQEQAKAELPEFIPENIFYLLAMKANNKTALAFQMKVANEILPSIRKTGSYSIQPKDSYMITDPIERAKAWIIEAEQTKTLTLQLEAQRPKVIFAEALEVSNNTILIGELAKILRQNGIEIGQNRLFEKLREDGYLIRKKGESFNQPTQRSMELELLEIKKRTINNPDGSVRATTTTKVTGKGMVYFVNKFKTALVLV